MSDRETVHVAVGVIVNDQDEVLVSRRHAQSHQGGLWEFPGGKVESGESVETALQREFLEELGIEVSAAFPFKKIFHDYGDKSVCLDIWRVADFHGQPRGLEGQPVEWCPVSQLHKRSFPAANLPICRALAIPFFMAITPQLESPDALLELLDHYVERDIKLVQLRQKALDAGEYSHWFALATAHLKNTPVRLLFNHDNAEPNSPACSVHASAARLRSLDRRPVADSALFSASCHDLEELQLACTLGVDFVTLSPVRPAAKYSDTDLLGWEGFRQLRRQVQLPVFALGGMQINDRSAAMAAGASGIASISAFLP